MSDSDDLSALCRRVLGDPGASVPPDVEACGPLLDLLGHDPRSAILHELLGGLADNLKGSAMRAGDREDAFRTGFAMPFRRLFWAELSGGLSAALAGLSVALKAPATPPGGRTSRLAKMLRVDADLGEGP